MSLDRQQYLDLFRGAIAQISGANGEPSVEDFNSAVLTLQKIAPFMPGAKAKLSVLTALGAGTDQNNDRANALFLEAALGGLPAIVRELGAIVLMSGLDDEIAGTLLKRALQGGDWIAGFLILREARRGRFFLNRDQLISIASTLSDTVPFKEQLFDEMQNLPRQIRIISGKEFDPELCRQALESLSQSPEIDEIKVMSDSPEIDVRRNVLSPFECDYLIAISCNHMQPSKVVSSEDAGSVHAGFRTSDGAVLLPHMLDLPVVRIIQKLSAAAKTPPENGEFLAMLRYRPGQEYRPHHDFLEADEKDYSMIHRCGQRASTLLTYLNDEYSGGETEFPALDFKYQGRVGAGLYFRNIDRTGKPIQDSLHAGLPIEDGEKWMATLWIREKKFWPWRRET